MKKIRIVMTMTAFALAVAGAVASTASMSPPPAIYVYTPGGLCVQDAASLPSGCNSSSGSQLCTVNTDDYGTRTAYSVQWDPFTCLTPYMRW